MPTYDYECARCGHSFEVFHGMMEQPVKRCPKCRGKTRRLIGTGAGIIFKGSGFYETDYRSDSYKDAEKKEKTASKSDSEKSADSKTPDATKTAGSEKTKKTKKPADTKKKGNKSC